MTSVHLEKAQDSTKSPLEVIANMGILIPSLQAPLPEELRDDLQRQVLQSKWFGLYHLETAYTWIMTLLIRRILIDYNRWDLSAGQLKKIHMVMAKLRNIDDLEDFNIRIPSGSGMFTFEIRENSLRLLSRQRNRLYDCRALSLKYVPDCIL